MVCFISFSLRRCSSPICHLISFTVVSSSFIFPFLFTQIRCWVWCIPCPICLLRRITLLVSTCHHLLFGNFIGNRRLVVLFFLVFPPQILSFTWLFILISTTQPSCRLCHLHTSPNWPCLWNIKNVTMRCMHYCRCCLPFTSEGPGISSALLCRFVSCCCEPAVMCGFS